MSEPAGGIGRATSAPDALTPVHDVHARPLCLNCGAPTAAAYCAACGQRVAEPDPTLRELVEELAGELLHWDGKLGATLKLLARRPGALTQEFLAGRRVAYISPLRLYLSASVLYFFVGTIVPPDPQSREVVRFDVGDSTRSRSTDRANGVTVSASSPSSDTAVAPGAGLGVRMEKRLESGVARAATNPAAFLSRIREHTGAVVFLILPAFALAVGLAYRSQRRHYPQHLVFALHVHAVAFIGFTLSELLRFAPRSAVRTAVDLLVTVAVLAYVVAALRRVYGGTLGRTVAKAATLGLVYLIFFGAGMTALVLYAFLTT